MKFSVPSILALVALTFAANLAHAKLNVIASTQDIAALARTIGGTEIDVSAIAEGSQDPHALEPKPSYIIKLSHADLLISNGLSLESGWLPTLIRGARNPKINFGAQGNLELGPSLDPIQVPIKKLKRANEEFHPKGNPHFTLDPVRMIKAGHLIAARLGSINPEKREIFEKNAKDFESRLQEKINGWRARVEKTGIKKIVTYHKTLDYFMDRFQIQIVAMLEPQPEVQPTAAHLAAVERIIQKEKVSKILVEHFFDERIADRIKDDIKSIKILRTPVSVLADPDLKTNEDLFERIVQVLEK